MLAVQTVSIPSQQQYKQNFGDLQRQIHLIKSSMAPQKAPRPTRNILSEQPKAFRVAAVALPKVGLDIAKMLDGDRMVQSTPKHSSNQPQAVLTASKPSPSTSTTKAYPSTAHAQPSQSHQQLKVVAQPAPRQAPSVAAAPRQTCEYDDSGWRSEILSSIVLVNLCYLAELPFF